MDYRSDIRSKDLITMAFLKTKFWGLFRDIENNRDLYTEIRLDDPRAILMFYDDEEKKYRQKYFDTLFEGLGYTENDVHLLRSILDDTFPGWLQNRNESQESLRTNSRIGNRDLLDLYFSYGASHTVFKEHMEEVKRVTENIGKDNDKRLTRRLKDFNRYILTQESPGDVARLLSRNLLTLQKANNNDLILIWRSWLRVFLQSKPDNSDAANRILASILSGASEAVQRAAPLNTSNAEEASLNRKQRADFASSIFTHITDYFSDPNTVLLMLLFLLPSRGNNFFEDYMRDGEWKKMFESSLNYVDEYFIGQNHNIFREYKWPEWQFTLYQWSLSINSSDVAQPNRAIEGADLRHRRVNNYVFNLLENDAKLTYTFIYNQFWSKDWTSDEYKWSIGGKIGQYNNQEDIRALGRVAKKAINSRALVRRQKDELGRFIEELDRFITDTQVSSNLIG